MEVDKLLSKWTALAREDSQYLESSKFRAIRNVFKELSVRDRLEESSRKHILELSLRGNQKELQKNRLDDLDLNLIVQALEELNTSNSVILDLQFNCISDAGMESLSKYLEVQKPRVVCQCVHSTAQLWLVAFGMTIPLQMVVQMVHHKGRYETLGCITHYTHIAITQILMS